MIKHIFVTLILPSLNKILCTENKNKMQQAIPMTWSSLSHVYHVAMPAQICVISTYNTVQAYMWLNKQMHF